MFIFRKLCNYIYCVHPFDYFYLLNDQIIGISCTMYRDIKYSTYRICIIYQTDSNMIRYYYGDYMLDIVKGDTGYALLNIRLFFI